MTSSADGNETNNVADANPELAKRLKDAAPWLEENAARAEGGCADGTLGVGCRVGQASSASAGPPARIRLDLGGPAFA